MDRKSRDNHKLCEFLEGVRRRCPDHLPVLEALGDQYTRMGRYQEGLEIDELLTDTDPRNELYWYNLACSRALVQQPDLAIAALNRAVELGYRDVEWMKKDSDLSVLRELPEFMRIVDRLEELNGEEGV